MEVPKNLEVLEATRLQWRNPYGDMKADDAKPLMEVEQKNARLKRLVAKQALNIDMLKEVNKGDI